MGFFVGLIGLNLIIFIHELGHYFIAKLFGIEVLTFSLGIGKKIFKKNFFNTEFCISLFPLGGYCRLKGDESLKEAIEKNLEYIPEEKNSMFSIHPLKRILIVLAGPFFNLFFAILIFSTINFIGYDYFSYSNKIVVSKEFKNSKLENGDKIIKIENKNTQSFSDIQSEIIKNNKKDFLNLVVLRNRLEKKLYIKLNQDKGKKVLGVIPWVNLVIETLGDKEAIAGLKKGDLILEINNKKVKNLNEFLEKINVSKMKYQIKYQRDGKTYETSALLNLDKNSNKYANIFFQREKFKKRPLSFFQSFLNGTNNAFDFVGKTAIVFASIFTGKTKVTDAISGPVKITYYMSQNVKSGFKESVSYGFTNFFNLLGILSVTLFFGNILPLPLLDGGYVILYLFEFLSRKKMKTKIIKVYYLIVILVMIGLFSLSIFSDFLFIGSKF